jgi:membrane protease YdiL (CAAX protease family)
MLTDKPWRLDALAQLGLALFISMSVGMLVAGLWASRDEGSFAVLVIGAVSFHGVALPCVGWFLWVHRLSWSEAFGFHTPGSGRAVLLAVGATVLALPFAWMLGWCSGELMKLVHFTPVPQKAVTLVQQTVAVGPQVFIAGVAVVVAPLAEELLFRGVLYPALRAQQVLRWNRLLSPSEGGQTQTCLSVWRRGLRHLAAGLPPGWSAWLGTPRPWAAAVLTSVLFGSIHLNVMTFLPLSFFGLVLIWLYEKTGNLLAPILSHSLFNLANFFFLVWGRSTP